MNSTSLCKSWWIMFSSVIWEWSKQHLVLQSRQIHLYIFSVFTKFTWSVSQVYIFAYWHRYVLNRHNVSFFKKCLKSQNALFIFRLQIGYILTNTVCCKIQWIFFHEELFICLYELFWGAAMCPVRSVHLCCDVYTSLRMSVHEVTGSDDVWCHPHPQIRRSYGN